MLEEGISLLKSASYFCREVDKINDGNRNENLNNQIFIVLESIKDLHNYWQSEYASMEDDEEYFD